MRYDENYKRLFAFLLMVEHLLRACLPAERLPAAVFFTLRKLSAEYVSGELVKRQGDAVWRPRRGDRWVLLLVLLEFRSEDDRWWALRILLTYTGLPYRELVRNQPPEVAAARLPAVLPVVLYNGAQPWRAAQEMGELITPVGPWLAPYRPAQRSYVLDVRRAAADDLPRRNLLRAVVGLEHCRSPGDVLRVVRRCRAGYGIRARRSCSARSWIGCGR